MRKLLWLTSLFIYVSCSFSQNLIDNPYFNRFPGDYCWSGTAGSDINGWPIGTGEVWGYHPCNPCQQLSTCAGFNHVPNPYFGEGMIGLQMLENSVVNHRGFIANMLLDTLDSGVEYTVEFRYRPWARNNYNIDRFGALATTDTFIWMNNYMNYTPQFEITHPITDTLNWNLAKGSFVAAGGEFLLYLGNFRLPSQVTQIPNPPFVNAGNAVNAWRWPMIYIDAVFLYKSTDTLYTATLPADTMLCAGEVLHLQPVLDGFKLEDTTTTYLWSTGSTDSSIVVTQPGTYWVQTTINHRFVAGDTLVVTYFPENYQLNLPDTVLFCEGEMATILAANIPLTAYQWSTGATTVYITTPMPGLYRLNAQTPCYPLSDSTWVLQDFCETHFWIPNAFTPDGDGTNDFFQFFGVPEPVTLSIYNRWGQRVFYSTNYQNDWDGSYKGEPLPGGAYTYLIEYKYINPNANQQDPKGSDRQIRGTVQVLR